VDFSSVAIDYCRRTFKDSNFVKSSVCELPFGDRSFDYVTAVHVLEHLDDTELSRTVGEIGRVLKGNGYVFVRSFTERDMRSSKRADSEIFYRFYYPETIEKAFEGFEVVSS
jgi:ubiquinone/menaquinone biosynthesis C-methylase UbiE